MIKRQTATIHSTFTHNILIRHDDGSYSANNYWKFGVFIAEATIVDDETKKIKRLRFESGIIDKNTIKPDSWQEFEKKVSDAIEANLDKFTEIDLVPSFIRII